MLWVPQQFWSVVKLIAGTYLAPEKRAISPAEPGLDNGRIPVTRKTV